MCNPSICSLQVANHLPNTLASVCPVAGVCKTWRTIILGNKALLASLEVQVCPERPLKSNGDARVDTKFMMVKKHDYVADFPVPRILRAASEAGNLKGTVSLAKIFELRGLTARAMTHWKKAAKAGVAEGQFRLGEAFYRGHPDTGQDPEEALMWLQRAAKNKEISSQLLSSAATILGYLHMDGEGTKIDNVAATKWFAIGKAHGNKEAERTLGWMWNTGQFG